MDAQSPRSRFTSNLHHYPDLAGSGQGGGSADDPEHERQDLPCQRRQLPFSPDGSRATEDIGLSRVRVDRRSDPGEAEPRRHGEGDLADHLTRVLRDQSGPEDLVLSRLEMDPEKSSIFPIEKGSIVFVEGDRDFVIDNACFASRR